MEESGGGGGLPAAHSCFSQAFPVQSLYKPKPKCFANKSLFLLFFSLLAQCVGQASEQRSESVRMNSRSLWPGNAAGPHRRLHADLIPSGTLLLHIVSYSLKSPKLLIPPGAQFAQPISLSKQNFLCVCKQINRLNDRAMAGRCSINLERRFTREIYIKPVRPTISGLPKIVFSS